MTFQNALRAGGVAVLMGMAPLSLSAAPVLAADDPVVATVDGTKIMRSEVTEAYSRLPAEYQQVPLEQIYPALLNSLIDTKLAAIRARKEKVHESPEFKEELAAFTERLLGSTLIQRAVDAKVTDDAIAARYAEVVKDMGGQVEVHARH
ncbi:MAG: peptidylprolyl isomerase, partial [Magnetovibrio sp.]|nr:peptidylprolyl isomerase [Magnetovibrio sp.]